MEIKYDQISHLVLSEKYEVPTYIVEFKDTNQDTAVEAFATVQPDNKSLIKNTGKKAVKTGVISYVIRSVARLFGGAVGGGVGGSIASSATHTVGHTVANKNTNSNDMMKVKMTDELKKEKVVEAFKVVQHSYEFNETENKWKFKTT